MSWFKTFGVFQSRMTFRDKMMLVNMVLYFFVGATLLIRSFLQSGSVLAYGIGCGLLFAGLYRGSLVLRVLKQIRSSVQ